MTKLLIPQQQPCITLAVLHGLPDRLERMQRVGRVVVQGQYESDLYRERPRQPTRGQIVG